MGQKYKNPPIVEAVCEFRLPEETPWDLTISGLLYGKIKETFPHKERRIVQEGTILEGQQGVQHTVRVSEHILFFTDDRKIWLQIGPHLAAVHCSQPYPTWEGFKPHIKNALQALTDIVEVKLWERIGLRYINRIEVPGPSAKLEDYFEFYPFLGRKLPQNMVPRMKCLFPFFEGRDACIVQLSAAVPEIPGNIGFLLDLDYFLAQPQDISVGQTLEWVEKAHQQVEDMFEGCITDVSRKLFQEVP